MKTNKNLVFNPSESVQSVAIVSCWVVVLLGGLGVLGGSIALVQCNS